MEKRDRSSLASCLPAGLIGLVSVLALPAIAAAPLDPHYAAGVFPPWWSQASVLEAASSAGALQSVGAVPFVVVIRAEGGDAAQRLRKAGALFSIDPRQALACGEAGRPDVPFDR